MNRLIPVFTLLLLCISVKVKAQNFEQQLFQALCNGLMEQEENQKLKASLKVALEVIDPVTNERTISLDMRDTASYNLYTRLNKENQRGHKVLYTRRVPFVPLPDKILIDDPEGIFSENHYHKNGKYFIVGNTDEYLLRIRQMSVRDNTISITCSHGDQYYMFTFDINGSGFTFRDITETSSY